MLLDSVKSWVLIISSFLSDNIVMISITALMENSASRNRALVNGHGLSLLIDNGRQRILFDCGPDGRFMENARRLGLSLSDIDALVISHGHYDHAAGFRDFAEAGYRIPELYIGKGFFDRKYSQRGIVYSDLSAGGDESFAIANCDHLHFVEGKLCIFPGIVLYQGFPRIHPEERIPDRFVRRRGKEFIPDDFSDEIALSINTEKGLLVIVGCSHPGIINMLKAIEAAAEGKIYGVIGGSHLSEADDGRIAWTLEKLKEAGVSLIGMCHCSGASAEEAIINDKSFIPAVLHAGDSVFL